MVLTGLTGSESWVEHCWSQAAIITTRDRQTERQTDRQTDRQTEMTQMELNRNGGKKRDTN